MTDRKKPVVAAFDFDGTITYSDSFIYFLLYTCGLFKTAWFLMLKLPQILTFLWKPSTRQQAKESVITQFFGGRPLETMRILGKQFALENLPRHIRPEALKRIAWHKEQKHTLILISASLDVYLRPWSEKIGFDHLIASRLDVSPEGIVTGKLNGDNCWGPEKCRRLTEILGPKENYTLYAYGDSKGDLDLLKIADYSYYREMPNE